MELDCSNYLAILFFALLLNTQSWATAVLHITGEMANQPCNVRIELSEKKEVEQSFNLDSNLTLKVYFLQEYINCFYRVIFHLIHHSTNENYQILIADAYTIFSGSNKNSTTIKTIEFIRRNGNKLYDLTFFVLEKEKIE